MHHEMSKPVAPTQTRVPDIRIEEIDPMNRDGPDAKQYFPPPQCKPRPAAEQSCHKRMTNRVDERYERQKDEKG